MPRLDGFGLVWEARHRPEFNELLIIVHSDVFTAPEDREFCEKLGADAFLPRLQDPARLAAEITGLWKAHEAGHRRPREPQLSESEYLRERLRRLQERLDLRSAGLAESERLLMEIAARSDDVIFKIDSAGRLLFINQAAERIAGRRPEELIGQSVLELVRALGLADVEAKFRKRMAGEPVPETYETTLTLPDGAVVTLEVRARPVLSEGKVVSVEGIARDVTERHKLLRALEEAKAEAELYLDLMGHDLQNFNQAAQGYLEYFLLSLPPGAPQIRHAQNVLDQIRASARFIDDVRRLATYRRLSGESLAIRDLRGLLTESVGRVLRDKANAPAKIEVGPLPEPGRVRAADALHDLLPLLAECARSGGGGLRGVLSLSVSGEISAGRRFWRLELGGPELEIPEQVRWNLEAHQAGRPASPHRPDLPMLALRALLQAHGGQVWAEEAPGGKGGSFVVLLPQAEGR